MILRYYPTKDASLYELYPSKNTGLDAMLEISKTTVGSGSYNSRIVINFDYSAISQSIVNLGQNPNLYKYHLKLYASEADQIPVDYNLYCYPIYGSWTMGVGRYSNYPETTDGVSWTYRNTANDITTTWETSSFPTNTTGSWATVQGGGVWYTSSVASQSFSYSTTDVDIDVTNIINKVQSGSISFQGFILKKSDVDENSTSLFNSLKFFSKDTHTIYLPVLEARYDDSINNGILPLIDTTQDYDIIPVNLKSIYNEKSSPLIRLSARYKYPPFTFSTSSEFLTRYKLPTGTQYAVYNASSDDVVIDFSEFTKISDDSTSNYVRLHLDSFQPERYYRLLLKVPDSGSINTYQVFDEQWIFKVTRG